MSSIRVARMAPWLLLALWVLALAPGVVPCRAQWFGTVLPTATKPAEGQANVAVDRFSTDAPVIYAAWMLIGAQKGDVVQGIWIAVDSGGVAPPNYRIDAASYTVPEVDRNTGVWGNFALSRPNKGWPKGTYEIQMTLNGKLVARHGFRIGD
jgi:hypothetical protein